MQNKRIDRKLALVGIVHNQILFSFTSDKDRKRTDSLVKVEKSDAVPFVAS